MSKEMMKKILFKHKNHGFSLVELILVIGIFSILAGIGVPLFSKWIPAYRLKDAAQTLYADFQKAKLHAIKSNRDVTFNFTAVADCSTSTGYTFTDTDGQIIASKTFDGRVCIYNSSFINSTSGFDPRGLQAEDPPSQHSVKIKYLNHAKEYEIIQSIAGSVTIQ